MFVQIVTNQSLFPTLMEILMDETYYEISSMTAWNAGNPGVHVGDDVVAYRTSAGNEVVAYADGMIEFAGTRCGLTRSPVIGDIIQVVRRVPHRVEVYETTRPDWPWWMAYSGETGMRHRSQCCGYLWVGEGDLPDSCPLCGATPSWEYVTPSWEAQTEGG